MHDFSLGVCRNETIFHQESITYTLCEARKLLILRSRNFLPDRLLDHFFAFAKSDPESEPDQQDEAEEIQNPENTFGLQEQQMMVAGAIARHYERMGLMHPADEFSDEWHEQFGDDWAWALRNSRWFHDRGAVPGEPFGYLDMQNDCPESASAVVVEHDSPGPQSRYEALTADGTSLGIFDSSHAAQAAAEAAVGSTGPAAPSQGTAAAAASTGNAAGNVAGPTVSASFDMGNFGHSGFGGFGGDFGFGGGGNG